MYFAEPRKLKGMWTGVDHAHAHAYYAVVINMLKYLSCKIKLDFFGNIKPLISIIENLKTA